MDATSVAPGPDDLIEPIPIVRKLRFPSLYARRRRPGWHRERRLLHVFLANYDPGEKLRARRQMQGRSPTDAMCERVHELRKRNRVTVDCVEDLSRVQGSGSSKQGRSGIELVEVVLPRLARARPVRPAEMKRGSICQ